MQQYQLENKSHFTPSLLKKAIRNAKLQTVQSKGSADCDLQHLFVAHNGVDSVFDELQIEEDRSERLYKVELYPLQKRLVAVQETIEANLRTIIGGARSGINPSDVSILAETPQYYLFYDKLQTIRDALKTEYGIPYTVVEAHRLKSTQILERLDPDVPSSDAPIWIIQKPANWYDGQWSVIQTFSHYLQCGMSPIEAMDYFMITTMNAPAHYWATIRGKTRDTIYNHVRKAKNKINPQEHPTEPSEYDYTGRTYGNECVEDTEYMTVDNGFLHPRRDIMNASLSGKMTSGYSGAGPKQLAVAILADLFGDAHAEQLAQELVGQLQHLASSDEDGTWQLSEEQLQQWYWSR